MPYRSKIPAVSAFYLRAAHVESMPIIHNSLDPFDQLAVTGLLKNDHIPNLDLAGWKGNPRREDILTFAIIRIKAVSLDFEQTQHHFREQAERRLL